MTNLQEAGFLDERNSKNVAGVSKRFYELSQDQHLIRKIEVDSETWTKIQEGKVEERSNQNR